MSSERRPVLFRGDGEPRTPADQIRLLAEIDSRCPIEPDDYSRGGTVERLERAMADELGKEASIFVATGTLANLLALRRHCQGRGARVLLQEQSHVYNDTGDSATELANLALIPLAPGQPAFTRTDVEAALDRNDGGRVATPIGCLSIESPVRRQRGRLTSLDEMRAITALCRDRGIPTHLDGARLYLMSAATGVPVREYCQLFDSVYVSLWKYLGAPFGAILAGSAAFVDGLYHDRRRFGGGLPSSALAAALVLDALPGFGERFSAALAKARELFAALNQLPGLCVESLPDGSNIFPLRLGESVDRDRLVAALSEYDVILPSTLDALTVNTTILRRPNDELVAAFAGAII